ncbi:MAG: deoxyguanosinetriphosphate triphosphohydrolase [Candidatus Omnitrophica bacterium]|nr:deoxyguanosinetriphosphate triphosphohydrolase [Candidatus Omnitrophota bacterium]MCB9782193.1 deoxyguanosinetriphosphate triphosphohydrolase [Candidatus Omnitrophota bacterium]
MTDAEALSSLDRINRQILEAKERSFLSPLATLSGDSLGRLYPEEEHSFRTAFQRDRDRLIHSTAFRRLEYKTQVFVNREGDYYRTRLTHTLEVVQIARSIARALALNEDLAEAMALAHDLGHTPFGHTVEEILDGLMEGENGFEHNAQGLRCVDLLEAPYSQFPGLNLTYEVRSIFTKKRSLAELRRLGFASPASERFDSGPPKPILEAQVVDLADSVAYNSHDIDDGIKSGLLNPDQLCEVDLWRKIWEPLKGEASGVRRRAAVRELINRQVTDLVAASFERMKNFDPSALGKTTSDEYPALGRIERLIDFRPEMRKEETELKRFLHKHLYRHPKVTRKMDKACSMIQSLFTYYLKHPEQMAPKFRLRVDSEPLKRVVCDYIAGMTDRFAEDEYVSLFLPDSIRMSH